MDNEAIAEALSTKSEPAHATRELATCGILAGLLLAGAVALFIVWFNILPIGAIIASGGLREKVSNFDSRTYTIVPETLLQSLDRGETGLFTLKTATPEAPREWCGECFGDHLWTQAEYFRAAQAAWQDGWSEPMDNLSLEMMFFVVTCSDAARGGFVHADFRSFKVIETGKADTRILGFTTIDPGYREAKIWRGEIRPAWQRYTPIDRAGFQVSAEDALKTAEANGGAGMRAIYRDDCEVRVSISTTTRHVWFVEYLHQKDEQWPTIYEVEVDPYTGDARVTYP